MRISSHQPVVFCRYSLDWKDDDEIQLPNLVSFPVSLLMISCGHRIRRFLSFRGLDLCSYNWNWP